MDRQTRVNADTGIEPAVPLRPLGLSLSVVGIALVAAAFCGLAGLLALLFLLADLGREGTTEFFQDLRFDAPLQTRLGAGLVATLYVGVSLGVLVAAVARGRLRWPTLLALTPHRRTWRPILLPAIGTLLYAACATYAMVRLRDHHLMIAGPTDLVLITTILVNLVVLAPIAEELLFRGWLYTALRRNVGVWPGGLVTAALFAAIHYDPNHRRIFLVLPLAVALGLVREASGSIKPTILLHATYNAIVVAITLANA